MKRTVIILAFLLLISSSLFAENLTQIVTEPSGSSLEILSNWRVIAILAILISVILVAMAYAIGMGFGMPEIEAWAKGEISQIFANVVIILALIAVVALIDATIMGIVNTSGVGELYCYPTENCLNKTVNAYLEDYLFTAKSGALNVLENNVEATAWANRRLGFNCYLLKCAQGGITHSIVSYYMLDSDRYSIIFEYYQGLLSSLHSQKFFINEICFKVGPLLLALGIVARTFFFSRKLGGLLIAIAAGIMFFFPAMYIFDWMTLDMTLTGDNGVQDEISTCPAECLIAPPIAFYHNTSSSSYVTLSKKADVYNLFDESSSTDVRKLLLGQKKSLTTTAGYEVFTCQINSSKSWFSDKYAVSGAADVCDQSCRELPYPHSASKCANYSMQLACSVLPEQCKINRTVVKIDESERAKCPEECRIVPPLKSDCRSGKTTSDGYDTCLYSRFDCRVAKLSDLNWRPSINSELKGAEKCNTYPKDCAANLTATESCVYVMPQFGSCSELCTGCPEECRFLNESDLSSASEPTCFETEGSYIAACKSCPSTCKINISEIEAKAPTGNNCSACPANHRILPAEQSLPANYTSDTGSYSCSLTSCASEYRLTVPRSACEMCVDAAEEYTYDPPLNLNCGDLCKPSDSSPSKSSGDYTKINEDDLVGMEEIKMVSKLMIPAYLLPLLNIAATITVIIALSGMLGGDIEIPGISKIF